MHIVDVLQLLASPSRHLVEISWAFHICAAMPMLPCLEIQNGQPTAKCPLVQGHVTSRPEYLTHVSQEALLIDTNNHATFFLPCMHASKLVVPKLLLH